MSIWKRLKNLWLWSEISPQYPKITPFKGFDNILSSENSQENSRTQATIIKIRPKDDVEEALQQVNEEQNG